MKVLAVITKPDAIRTILDHLGIPSEASRCTTARPPPQAELSGTADIADVDYADPPRHYQRNLDEVQQREERTCFPDGHLLVDAILP
jgi:hypothetical protein